MLSGCERGLSAHIGHLKRSLNTVREVIVLPHCGIKSQQLYFLPTQSPNTDTGTSPSPTTQIRVESGEQLCERLWLVSPLDQTRYNLISEQQKTTMLVILAATQDFFFNKSCYLLILVIRNLKLVTSYGEDEIYDCFK